MMSQTVEEFEEDDEEDEDGFCYDEYFCKEKDEDFELEIC